MRDLTHFAFAKAPVNPPRDGAPELLAGRYLIERVLGAGGMGVVYRARDLLHEQFGEPCSSVAIKVLGEAIRESADAHVLLYNEFALTRSLRHEQVVRVYSFEVDAPPASNSGAAYAGVQALKRLRLKPGEPAGACPQASPRPKSNKRNPPSPTMTLAGFTSPCSTPC